MLLGLQSVQTMCRQCAKLVQPDILLQLVFEVTTFATETLGSITEQTDWRSYASSNCARAFITAILCLGLGSGEEDRRVDIEVDVLSCGPTRSVYHRAPQLIACIIGVLTLWRRPARNKWGSSDVGTSSFGSIPRGLIRSPCISKQHR